MQIKSPIQFFSLSLKLALISAILHACTGCAFNYSYNSGDARAHTYRSIPLLREFSPGVLAKHAEEYTFPEVSLATAHTVIFRLRGKLSKYTAYSLRRPKIDDIHRQARVNVILPWHRCTLLISAATEDGEVFHSEMLRLGDLVASNPKPKLPNWGSEIQLPRLSTALGKRSDFDIRITVETSSASSKDSVLLSGKSWEDY